ncbi:MAG: hypothetical protein ACLTYN_05695 [Dysosmobacter welbionis]
MYHLLSVSSAMLISFLIGLLFAAMCAIWAAKRVFHCIVIRWAFWQAHLLAYSDSSTRSDAGQ